jgi:hypothetical protein
MAAVWCSFCHSASSASALNVSMKPMVFERQFNVCELAAIFHCLSSAIIIVNDHFL